MWLGKLVMALVSQMTVFELAREQLKKLKSSKSSKKQKSSILIALRFAHLATRPALQLQTVKRWR
jgi:hypothetical protein